ncbi:hypothetical protein [Halosimplex pelagicum]|uniref:Uncharacterized protein n=1 Tax=Halosimplex pelagicum TaxID=869886 RepID=A0A7D5PF14_9EURY|nr:hypothetical protein [Halosimplex pelagicum]QLH82239.1 hypothetical protein HZS54_11740 [Halosimplex pelagicum]
MIKSSQQLENALHANQPPQEKAQTVLAVQSAILSDALEKDDNGGLYRDLFWEYAEKSSQLIINATIQNGTTDWEFLCDLLNAYPADGDHHVHTQLVHGIGSGILNTRMTGELGDAPPAGFEYLYQTGIHTIDAPWEDAFCITWYFDHPEIDVIDRLHEFATNQDPPTFVSGALKLGTVVNNEKAVDLFIRFDQDSLIDSGPALLGLDNAINGSGPQRPRYFNYKKQYGASENLSSEATEKLLTYIQNHWPEAFIRELNSATTLDLLKQV